MLSRPIVSAAWEEAVCSFSKSDARGLVDSLEALALAGCWAGDSGVCETAGLEANRSRNTDDASFNFHLVAGFADGRRKRGGPYSN
jgi:hypothetical protein